jgi:hypothetical protein
VGQDGVLLSEDGTPASGIRRGAQQTSFSKQGRKSQIMGGNLDLGLIWVRFGVGKNLRI